MNEQGRQSAHDGCDPLSAGPEWAAATRQRLPPPAFLKILSFEEAAYLLGCAPSVVCRLVMETGELAAVRFTTSGERLGAFSPDDIHGVMDRVGEDGSITATVPASGNLIDPGWRDIKAGILRIDRTELDRFITMNTPAVALPEPVAPAPMPSASPAPSDDLILELRRHREAIERAAHEADQRHTHEQAHAGFARIRAATEAGIKATQATQKPNASPAPAEAPPAPVAERSSWSRRRRRAGTGSASTRPRRPTTRSPSSSSSSSTSRAAAWPS